MARERDALFRGRGRLSGGGRDSDCERRDGAGEQTMHGVGQPTSTRLESHRRSGWNAPRKVGERVIPPIAPLVNQVRCRRLVRSTASRCSST